MPSKKTAVIEHIFFERKYSHAEKSVLDNGIVTFDDIRNAIVELGVDLSTGNVANFWKDIIRNARANALWPTSVLEEGYTGTDAIGRGDRASFMFVPLRAGQIRAFPEGPTPSTSALEQMYKVESLSLPLVARELGGGGESWITEVVRELRLIESHFAFTSAIEAREVAFVQSGRKFSGGEVDAIWRISDSTGAFWLAAVEVKGVSEVVWEAQVIRAARELLLHALRSDMAIMGVVPLAAKVLSKPPGGGQSVVHVIEYSSLRISDIDQPDKDITAVRDTVFEVIPAVPGL